MLFGMYKKKDVYSIKLAEFITLPREKKYSTEYYWMIQDDYKLIYGGKVQGEVDVINMRVYELPSVNERIYYRKAYKENEEISLLDSLYREGENRLASLLNESMEKIGSA